MNAIVKENFYIISGGPGAGKTSLITALKAHGYLCVDEVARQIIQEQVKIDGDALHWKDQVKFRGLMLSRSIYTFEQMINQEGTVFFDRGIPELINYCRLINCDVPQYLHNAVDLFRYNKQVFLLPPWEEIYHVDSERKQDWEEAEQTYHGISKAYMESDYQVIELPKTAITERVDFILRHMQTG